MSQTPDRGRAGPARQGAGPGPDGRPERPEPAERAEHPAHRGPRHALWLLLVPAVLYCLAPLVANRIEPRVLGLPFLLVWIIAVTVVSPLVLWAVARLDPVYRAGALEPIPADGPEGAAVPEGAAGTAGGVR